MYSSDLPHVVSLVCCLVTFIIVFGSVNFETAFLSRVVPPETRGANYKRGRRLDQRFCWIKGLQK